MSDTTTPSTLKMIRLNTFRTVCKCKDFVPKASKSKSVEYFDVTSFTYALAQFNPSPIAIIDFEISSDDIESYNKFKAQNVKDRQVEISYLPNVYNTLNPQRTFFAGPHKFVAVNVSQPINENGKSYHCTLSCVDGLFWKLKTNHHDDKGQSKGKIKASEFVKKLIEEDNGYGSSSRKLLVDTNKEFKWIQYVSMSDYHMIESLLRYSVSNDNKGVYVFFTIDNQYYFAPMGTSKLEPITIPVNNIMTISQEAIPSGFFSTFIQNGSTSLIVNNHGFSSFDCFTTDENTYAAKPSGSKQGATTGSVTKTVNTQTIEDQTLMKNYAKNRADRIQSFNKIVTLTSNAIPDITPFHCVRLVNTDSVTEKGTNCDGVYYVLEVVYQFGGGSSYNFIPTMTMLLCSEIDIDGGSGTSAAEKTSVVESTDAVKSTVGTESATNMGQSDDLTAEEQKKWDDLVEWQQYRQYDSGKTDEDYAEAWSEMTDDILDKDYNVDDLLADSASDTDRLKEIFNE